MVGYLYFKLNPCFFCLLPWCWAIPWYLFQVIQRFNASGNPLVSYSSRYPPVTHPPITPAWRSVISEVKCCWKTLISFSLGKWRVPHRWKSPWTPSNFYTPCWDPTQEQLHLSPSDPSSGIWTEETPGDPIATLKDELEKQKSHC